MNALTIVRFTLASLLLALSLPSMSATYTFSYEFDSGNLITGEFEGALQGDGDTVLITSGGFPFYDGVFYPGLAPVSIAVGVFDDGSIASFSGIGVNITAPGCVVTPIEPGCVGDGSFSLTGIGGSASIGGEVGNNPLPPFTTFVGESNPFNAAKWTLDGPGAVPLPAAAWLFGSALLGLAGLKRFRHDSGA